MNKVILMGNLARDPQLRTTGSGTPVASFSVACQRRFKDQNGERQADFIDCVAWRQQADFVTKYFHKGSKILVEGSLRSRNYEDNQGIRRYVTEVVVDNIEFAGGGGGGAAGGQTTRPAYGSAPVPAPAPAAHPAEDVFEDDVDLNFQPLDDGDLPF